MTRIDEWRAGWPVVAAALIGVGFTALHFYTLGIFIKPLQAEFGWGRGAIAAGPPPPTSRAPTGRR